MRGFWAVAPELRKSIEAQRDLQSHASSEHEHLNASQFLSGLYFSSTTG